MQNLRTKQSRRLQARMEVSICPICKNPDDNSPMIACDQCDKWFHWHCAGVHLETSMEANWFCRRCMRKKLRRQREWKNAERISQKRKGSTSSASRDMSLEELKNLTSGDRERVSGGKSEKDKIVRKESGKNKPPGDLMLPKRGNELEEAGNRQDMTPVKILGVTTEPGDLHFFVDWGKPGMEASLVSKEDAYKKFPQMCLEYFESMLIWRDTSINIQPEQPRRTK